jgi:hypothetical protein
MRFLSNKFYLKLFLGGTVKKLVTISFILMVFGVFVVSATPPHVSKPEDGQPLKMSIDFKIIWESCGYDFNCHLILYQNDIKIGYIQKGVSFKQECFNWKVGQLINQTVPVGSNYQIKISGINNNQPIEIASGKFKIIPKYTLEVDKDKLKLIYPKIIVTKPTANITLYLGKPMEINWKKESADNYNHLKIELFHANGVLAKLITSSCDNNGTYLWPNIATDLNNGSYYVRLSAVNGLKSGKSPVFTLKAMIVEEQH